MILTYIRWMDACSEESAQPNSEPVTPTLCELQEIGFLLAEDDLAVTIGMEISDSPGRWRLHVPKSGIIERRDFELPAAKTRRKK
jgi:hypothetical protein